MRALRNIPGLLLLTAFCLAARAEDAPKVTVQLSAQDIFFGESVNYQVHIWNVHAPSLPDVSAFSADFEIGVPSVGQKVRIVNNDVTTDQIYTYRLKPKRAGVLTVPAPIETVNGQKIAGPTVALQVREIEKQDLVIAEIQTSRAQVYPTQPFEVTLRILLKPLPSDSRREPLAPLQSPPSIELNWVDAPAGLKANKPSDWLNGLITHTDRGFTLNSLALDDDFGNIFGRSLAVFNLYKGRVSRLDSNGAATDYFSYELTRTFTAEQMGAFTFGPATIKGVFVDGMSGQRYTGRRLVVVAPAKTVEVKEVPLPRPRTFCGGIGAYRLSATVTPLKARVGDPLSLTLQFERQPGSGALSLLSAPDLGANPELTANFDIIDSTPTGEVSGETKRFTYGLRPKKAGVSLPAITATLFSPETEKFTGVQTAPVKLQIADVTHLNASDLVGTVALTPNREIHTNAQGVFQDLTDVAALEDQRPAITRYMVGALLMWLAYGLLHFVVARRRHLALDAAWQRRQHAHDRARKQLQAARTALSAGQPLEAMRGMRASLAGLIGDMLNLPAPAMTAHDAKEALGRTNISGETRGKTVALLESVEAMEYSSASQPDVASTLATLEQLLPELHRNLERNA